LFRLSINEDCNTFVNLASCLNSECNDEYAIVWHSWLCHINFDFIIRLSKLNLIPKIHVIGRSKRHACVQAKQPRKHFKSVEGKSLAHLELIHSDQLYLIKMKDEALDYFKIYKAEVKNQLERKIKCVRYDRGGEYLSNDFGEYCAEHGIIHETTIPYSPQSNGVAEWKNRTLMDLVNAMLDYSGLSKSWRGEAILTACFVQNRVPSSKGEITPRKLALGFLRTWGCLAKVNVSACKK
jgi:hypothetical protein